MGTDGQCSALTVDDLRHTRGGPWFSPAQRRWIAQRAEQPLRLWRVTERGVGQGLTPDDAIDTNAEPVRAFLRQAFAARTLAD